MACILLFLCNILASRPVLEFHKTVSPSVTSPSLSNGSDSNNTGTMKRKKQQQQHCSGGNANGLQSNGIPPQLQLQQQQKVYVSLYPQMMGATEPNYETLSRQQVVLRIIQK